jgi:hypothetical protein
MAAVQHAQWVAHPHPRPRPHRGSQRFVLGPDTVRVRDHYDAATRDKAGELHETGACRPDDLPAHDLQVDAEVAGAVLRLRRREPA